MDVHEVKLYVHKEKIPLEKNYIFVQNCNHSTELRIDVGLLGSPVQVY